MDRSFRSLGMSLLPTPLEDAPRLARALGIKRLLIKREDLSGTGLGGNKLRQIDLLLAEAIDQDATTLITTADAQSNFCRAVGRGSRSKGYSRDGGGTRRPRNGYSCDCHACVRRARGAA